MLHQIGYFPLMGGYKHLFKISNTKKYKAGTSFEEIVSLYKFDAELRELFFRYLLQIERHMRSLMSYYFSELLERYYQISFEVNDTPPIDSENVYWRSFYCYKRAHHFG